MRLLDIGRTALRTLDRHCHQASPGTTLDRCPISASSVSIFFATSTNLIPASTLTSEGGEVAVRLRSCCSSWRWFASDWRRVATYRVGASSMGPCSIARNNTQYCPSDTVTCITFSWVTVGRLPPRNASRCFYLLQDLHVVCMAAALMHRSLGPPRFGLSADRPTSFSRKYDHTFP